MKSKILGLLAVGLLAGPINANAATMNGFANGGFETVGSSTPAASWLAAASGYSLSTDARTGQYSAQLSAPAFSAAVMLQNSIKQGGLPALIEGDTPILSFWAKGFAGTTGNVLYALRYLDGNGFIVANSQNQFFQNSINPNTWSQITYNLGPVPAGAVAAFIEFSQAIGPISGGALAGTVLIDDLYLGVAAPIPAPEPGSLALLALGLAGLGLSRRRKAN